MRSVTVDELPKCYHCDNTAKYDSPASGSTGNWTYKCEEHQGMIGSEAHGTRLVLEEVELPNDGITVMGFANVSGDTLHVECPMCNKEHTTGCDAVDLTCNGCGVTIEFDYIDEVEDD